MDEKNFYMLLDGVKILNNHDIFKGEVRLVSVACTDLDKEKKSSILQVETPLFKGVRDGDFLPLGSAGKLLYTSKDIPIFLNWSLWIIEDDEDIRKSGELINSVMESEEFKNIESTIRSSLSLNPSAQLVQTLVSQAAKLIANVAMKNKNDQIGVIDTTFVNAIHDISDYSTAGDPCGDARIAYSLQYV